MLTIPQVFQKQSGNPKLRTRFLLVVSFLIFLFNTSAARKTQFSQENAAALLRTLVLEIGARPMGSPAEQKAFAFAVSKFKEYGCDTSYIMPMTVAGGVNTTSGIAVGVKKGKTNRIIVIGGHIDSSGPDVPGANDDGSGTACTLELARVLCKRENESTVVFGCWGGEEQGLRGSKHFVDTFPDIDSVALMLQIDMADGAGILNADPDGSKMSAPSWLVESSFDIFYNDLKSDGLVYPTEAATWNLAVGGAFGSDHVSFIDKGIPSIDFTSDPTFPIHTPQDRLENFTTAGLQRCGDFVLKLFEKYDVGIPSHTLERYQLFQIGRNIFFVPYAVLWTFIVIAFLASLAALVTALKRRPSVDPLTKIKWSGTKLLLATLFVQLFIWNSESVIGFIRGYRYPWVNNFAGFAVFGILCGLLGLWFVLQVVRKYRLSEDPFLYARVAFILFWLFTAGAALVTPELAIYPAAALFCFSLTFFLRSRLVKILLFVFAIVVMWQLVFFDGIGLFERLLALNPMSKMLQKILYSVGFVIVFGLLTLPFTFGFAAIYRDASLNVFKMFRTRAGLIAVSVAILAVGVFLCTRPVYDRLWFTNTRIEQRYVANTDSSSVEIKSPEFLTDLSGTINGRDTVFSGRSNYAKLDLRDKAKVFWCEVAGTDIKHEKPSDSTFTIERTVLVRSQFRPLRVDAVFESAEPFEISSTWEHGARTPDPSLQETSKRKRFSWYSFPDTNLTIPVRFTLRDSQQVTQEITVQFDSLAYPLRLHREFTNISYRTIVTNRDTFSVKTFPLARR